MTQNTLYYGDNLDILRRYVKPESVDLIYLDPPFNSQATYNVLFGEQNGSQAAAQIQAFDDTWTWDETSARTYRETVERGGRVSQVLQAFRTFLGPSNMLAYLAMMAPRLVELRRALKPTGTIYLHCDPTASHYLKLLMDAVFGIENFLNEIIWRRYKRPKGSQYRARRYGSSTDTLLFYAKGPDYQFHLERIKVPLTDDEISERYSNEDQKGKWYSGPALRSPSMGERPNLVYEYKGFMPGPAGWRMTKEKLIELDEQGDLYWTSSGTPRRKIRPEGNPGKPVDNLWTDIEALGSQAKERLGYPTQKPEELLERIIEASSNEGNLILDPFCGCGTTVAVAERLGRRWIGIDITHLAIGLMKYRLQDTFGDEVDYEVIGEPVALTGAQTLADSDPYQFEWWALGLVGARPIEQKKGADRGIDGRLYFHDEAKGETKQVIFSVKAGQTGVAHIRDLRGVVEREDAQIGVLITMQEPTRPMRQEAASAGFYHSPGWNTDHPKIQILTIAQLLDGGAIDMPPLRQVSTTFKKAPRSERQSDATQGKLDL